VLLKPPIISKLPPVSLDPSVAQVQAPAVTTGQAENRMEVSAYLTRAGETQVLYNGDRMWGRVTLTLRTAGPVSIGQQAKLVPVLSGIGQLLQTGVPTVFNVPKGNKLYVAATGVNVIGVLVEAIPWLETITGLLGATAGATRATAVAAVAPPMGARRSTGKAG